MLDNAVAFLPAGVWQDLDFKAITPPYQFGGQKLTNLFKWRTSRSLRIHDESDTLKRNANKEMSSIVLKTTELSEIGTSLGTFEGCLLVSVR